MYLYIGKTTIYLTLSLYFSGHLDPCEELSCPKYAKCVPSFDGASASCVCPEPCSNDPVDESTVVCGKNHLLFACKLYLLYSALHDLFG